MPDRLTICTDNHADETLARAAQEHLLDGITATHVADLFKALSDPTRVCIVSLLAYTELCVGDLRLLWGMTQPAVSHQLRILRSMHIVTARKERHHVFYTLTDEHIHDWCCPTRLYLRCGYWGISSSGRRFIWKKSICCKVTGRFTNSTDSRSGVGCKSEDTIRQTS